MRLGDRLVVVGSPERYSLLDLDRIDEPPVVLEGSAATIWAAIDGERDALGVVAAVAAEVGVEPDVVAADVGSFLNDLHGRGLVRTPTDAPVPAPSTPAAPHVEVTEVVLIGNYLRDGQESMLRFADAMRRDLTAAGLTVRVWRPPVVLGRLAESTGHGVGKWLGYVDKWLLFPPLLVLRLLLLRRSPGRTTARPVFHVCDHSNAPYLRWLPRDRTVITCHDVLAIRGAMGHAASNAPASATGRLFQRWIRGHLLEARCMVADSQQTLDQVEELAAELGVSPPARRVVIPLALNGDFTPMDPDEAHRILRPLGLADEPFLLHVGASHPRKNRPMLLRLAADPTHPWTGLICFAGEPVDPDLAEEAERLGLIDRVHSVPGATHEQLVALYSSCAVFVFPSLSEGFGWPVIEAQACGAPVVASNRPPMPEVGGPGATYVDPADVTCWAATVAAQLDPATRRTAIDSGRTNVERFAVAAVRDRYTGVYDATAAAPA